MVPKNILWLPGWYPNRSDPFDGDFIQRHAQAAAVHHHIHVLFVKPMPLDSDVKQEIAQTGNLTEQIIYIKKEHGVLKKFHRQLVWFQQYKKAIEAYIKVAGLPQLVHVHVPWRAGLIALWMKKKYGTPFIITEHWGIYNDVVEDRFSAQPFWMQKLLKTIYSQSTLVVSVSCFLATAISKYIVPKSSVIVHNVVDTNLFFYQQPKQEKFTFLHVSNMVPLKNVAGILDAFALFRQEYSQTQLVLVGNKDDVYQKYAHRFEIDPQTIILLGEIPYAEVAKEMQSAHCLIVNSLMENSPCVIGEALCCGLPVIATKVGGIPELVDASNSILILPNNTASLLDAMQKMYADFKKFDQKAIAEAAEKKYGYPTIAAQFSELYTSVHAVR